MNTSLLPCTHAVSADVEDTSATYNFTSSSPSSSRDSFSFTIIDDPLVEMDEVFFVVLQTSTPLFLSFSQSSINVSITSDDREFHVLKIIL